MKILTYNIWNSKTNYKERLELLYKLVADLNIDIIALQEVHEKSIINELQRACGLNYALWKPFEEDEGLGLLSKFPIIYEETNWERTSEVNNSFVLRTVLAYNHQKIGITNLHLDYASSLNREIEIVKTIKMLEEYRDTDFEILLGDLNSYPESSIYNYLTGRQSLHNHATDWVDLHKVYSLINNKPLKPTIDFLNNPRWDNENVLEEPGRFDYIMLKSPYPRENPRLKSVKLIGDERVNNITPSDHYGVLCEIDFSL